MAQRLHGRFTMRKTLAIFLTCVAFISQTFALVHAVESEQDWLDAEEKVSEFIPKLHILGDEYPNDVEIQLGITALYDEYGVPQGSFKSPHELRQNQEAKISAQFEKVLTIDPNNKAVWALKVDYVCRYYTAQRRDLLDQLESKIAYARERNVEEFRLYKNSDLYNWFKEEGMDTVVIRDFDLAVRQLRQKLDEKVPAVLATLNRGQSNDTENAFYNYLKAHLYFVLHEKEKALKEIEEGAAKKYFSSYVEEINKAKARVLREAKFPQPHRDLIISIRSPFEDFLRQGIWKLGLADLGKSYEEQGDFKNAEKVYRLTITMAQQAQRESIYRPLGLDVVGRRHLEKLQKKMLNKDDKMPAQEKKILGQSFLERAKYIIIVALCGIVIAGLTLLVVKKKASSRGKSRAT